MTTITETKTGIAAITAGSTSAVVLHGLSTTPTVANITVSPLDDLGGRNAWPSAPTGTNFTINMSTEDLVSHQFSWAIVYSVDISTGGTVGGAPSGTYCTSDDVKAFSSIAYTDLGYSADADFVSFLDSLIAYAGSVIDEFCRVPEGYFNSGGYVVTNELYDYKYPYTQLYVFPLYKLPPIGVRYQPIISIDKVEYNTTGYGLLSTWVEITTPGYIFDPVSCTVTIVMKLPAMAQLSIRLSYTAGYENLPDLIRYTCAQLCAGVLHEFLQRKLSPQVQANNVTMKLVATAAFTGDLKGNLLHLVRRFASVG